MNLPIIRIILSYGLDFDSIYPILSKSHMGNSTFAQNINDEVVINYSLYKNIFCLKMINNRAI